jgi:hypothetical protein
MPLSRIDSCLGNFDPHCGTTEANVLIHVSLRQGQVFDPVRLTSALVRNRTVIHSRPIRESGQVTA